jgi:hypothetical protein
VDYFPGRIGVLTSVSQLTGNFDIYLAVELYKVFDTPHDRFAFFDYSTDMQEFNSATFQDNWELGQA